MELSSRPGPGGMWRAVLTRPDWVLGWRPDPGPPQSPLRTGEWFDLTKQTLSSTSPTNFYLHLVRCLSLLSFSLSPHCVTKLFALHSRPPCSPVSSPPFRASPSSDAHSRPSQLPRPPSRAWAPVSRLPIRSQSSQATTTFRSHPNLQSTTRRIPTHRTSRPARSLIWSMEASMVDLGVFPWAHSLFLRRLSSTRFRLEG